MNQAELIEEVAGKVGLTKKEGQIWSKEREIFLKSSPVYFNKEKLQKM